MAHYIKDREFFYAIRVSQGKGDLTLDAEKFLILLGTHTMQKFAYKYKSVADRDDCFQQGLLHLFSNWKTFDGNKFDKAMPYFTEIFKRGVSSGLNLLLEHRSYDGWRINISIQGANDGNGLHTF